MTDTTAPAADLSAAEDFAAFEASVDTPATPAAPVAPEVVEPAPEADADPVDEPAEGEGEAPKPKKSAQQRIDELTWKAREAERREKDAVDRLERALRGEVSTPAREPQAAPDGAPNPDHFEYGETDIAYIREVTRYETRLEIEAQRQADDFRRQIDGALQTFTTRLAEQFPEGETPGLKAWRSAPTLPPVLQEIALDSVNGPKLADFYGSNPDELQRLSAMPPHKQAYEIAKIEAGFAPATPAKPQTKIATTAPEPAPQARGAGGQFKVPADTDDFAAFDKAY